MWFQNSTDNDHFKFLAKKHKQKTCLESGPEKLASSETLLFALTNWNQRNIVREGIAIAPGRANLLYVNSS